MPRQQHREPERPPKRPIWHHLLLALLGLAAIAGIISLLVTTHGRTHVPAVPHHSPAPAHTPPAAHVGSSFVTSDGAGHTYRVTLNRIIDPAQGNVPASAGNRLVGAEYTITGMNGSPQGENVITNASLLGSNGHIYRANGGQVNGIGNFNNFNINVAPGSSETGAATYQMPSDVHVTQAQWAAHAGNGTINRWHVP